MTRQHQHICLVFVLAMASLVGCQRKCQPPGEPLRSFVDQEFRLVQSSDPQVKQTLTNTNFQTIAFRINYVGEVYRVEDNDRYDNPALVFKYNVDATRKVLRIQFYEPATDQGQGNGATAAQGAEVGGIKDFQYTLTNELKLRETSTGFTYRYVPFTGVVKPDEVCEF